MKTTLIKRLRATYLAKVPELGMLATQGDRSAHRPYLNAKAKMLSHGHSAQARIKEMKAKQSHRGID